MIIVLRLTPAGVRDLVVIFPVEAAASEQVRAGHLPLGLRVDAGANIADGSPPDPSGPLMSRSKGVIPVQYRVSHDSRLLLAARLYLSLLSFLPSLDLLTERPLDVVVVALLHLPLQVSLLRHDTVRVTRLPRLPVPGDQAWLSLVEIQKHCALIGWILCHKDTAQGTQSPRRGAFLAFHCIFMA